MRTVIAILLAICAVVTGAAWLDSYRTRSPQGTAGWYWRWDDMASVWASTYRGSLTMAYETAIKPGTSVPPIHHRIGRFRFDQEFRTWVRESDGQGGYEHHRVRKLDGPFWFYLLLFAAYPTFAVIRDPLRRYRRRKRGLCATCGYNLTGLPEPRCPECGEAV